MPSDSPSSTPESPGAPPPALKPSEAQSGDGPRSGCAVHVQFSPSQGSRLQRPEPTTCADGQALWAERPLLMKRADGTFELIGTTNNLSGLARWVLSYGPDAEVQGPDRLRRYVVREARRTLQLYDAE